MKRRTLVLWTLALGVIGGGVAFEALRGEDPITVNTARAEMVPHLRAIVSATGEIRAKEFVDIQAEVAGVITELLVREGDEVEKGAVLLRLDDLQLKADEDAARAHLGAVEAEAQNAEVGVATAEATLAAEKTALANTKVELEQARITSERAEASFQRKKQLFDAGLLNSEEFEVASADARITAQKLEWSEARVRQAEANLHAVATRVEAAKAMRDSACRRIEAAKAELARATDLLGKTVLRAPLTGLITKLNVEKGERAVPGIQSNPIATLMTIADMSVIEAEIRVDEADIVNVQLGAKATVQVDALRDVDIEGIVTEIGHSPIQPSATQTSSSSSQSQEGKDFKVVVRLVDPPPTLRPGFTATADIITAVRDDILVIPLQALTAREVYVDEQDNYVPQTEQEALEEERLGPASRKPKKEMEGVFLPVNERAHFRPVKTGITGEMDIEVLSGLEPGDEVITGPYQVLRTLKEWDHVMNDKKRNADELLELRRKRR